MLAIENVHDLEIALAASRQGSFSGAARALNITQPAVSQAVARLERQLGTSLFDRQESGHPGFLTDAGAVLITHAIAAIDELTGAVSDLAELEGERPLCVGMPPLLAKSFFPENLEILVKACKGRPNEIVLHDSERLFEELRLHRIDVGLISSTDVGPVLPHVTFAKVASYPLVLIVRSQDMPAGGSLSLSALARAHAPVIAFSGDLALHDTVSARLQHNGAQLNVVAETDQLEMLWQLVEAGLGVGLASGLVVGDVPEGVICVQPSDLTDVQQHVFVFEDAVRAKGPAQQQLMTIRRLLFSSVRKGRRVAGSDVGEA